MVPKRKSGSSTPKKTLARKNKLFEVFERISLFFLARVELFSILNNFFQKNNLHWKYCVGLCTDGARAMTGRFGGLQTLVQGVAVNAKWTHCLIQHEALAS